MMLQRELLVFAVIFMVVISCREENPSEGKETQSQSSHVELRMTDAPSAQSMNKLLLSSELKKISTQIETLIGDTQANVLNTFISIDSTGTALSSRLFMESDPQKIIEHLNECFFEQMKIVVEKRKASLANTLPEKVYESKSASEIGAVILMLLLAEEADVQLVCMKANKHYFVRFDNGKDQFNLELSKGGQILSDSWFITTYCTDSSASDSLRKLTSMEVIGLIRFAIGNAFVQESKYELALLNYAYALEKYRNFPECQLQLDYVVDMEKNSEKMLNALIQMRSAYPELSSFNKQIALLYFRTGNYSAAADCYQRALGRAPDDYVLIKGAGMAYLNMHEFTFAKQYLTKAASIMPSDSQVTELLTQCP